jgi:hypothetical protein
MAIFGGSDGDANVQKLGRRQQQYQIMIGITEEHPLKKLLAGFCGPFINQDGHEDEERTEVESSPEDSPGAQQSRRKYMADLRPQVEHSTRRTVLNDIHIPIIPNPKPNSNNTNHHHQQQQQDEEEFDRVDHENRPEFHVIQIVASMRRKRGIEVFLASSLFVFGTLFTLTKLGYSIADLHFPTSSPDTSFPFHNNRNNRWIHVYDKRKVQKLHYEIKTSDIPSIDPPAVMGHNENTMQEEQEKGYEEEDYDASSSSSDVQVDPLVNSNSEVILEKKKPLFIDVSEDGDL